MRRWLKSFVVLDVPQQVGRYRDGLRSGCRLWQAWPR